MIVYLLLVLTLCGIGVYSQALAPSTFIATYHPYLGDSGITFYSTLPFHEVIYTDPNYGQRTDVYLYNMQDYPYYSSIILTKNFVVDSYLFLIHNYNDVTLDEPICFETAYPYADYLNVTLTRKVALGTVLNESTITFVDMDYRWYQVVNNTRGRYYPRSISTIEYAGIFTDFEMVIPYQEAWKRPSCFPNFPVKRSVAPPVAPVPTSYSFTIYDALFTSTHYVDGVHNYFRTDTVIPLSTHYPTLTITNLIRGTTFYFLVDWVPISPTPCVFLNSTQPYRYNLGGVYFGTVSVGNDTNPKYFNIYGQVIGGMEYLAFDSDTHNLEVLYSVGDMEREIGGWNPTAPPFTTFTPPVSCYPTSANLSSAEPHPLAPSFPMSMTMYTFDGIYETIVYYDGVNQMWRIDTAGMTLVQRGNLAYVFVNTNSPSAPLISPLPCYQYAKNYGFIPGLPETFSSSLGTATYNGIPVTVWSGAGEIWYFDATNTPQFFFYGPVAHVVSYFQPGPPPSGVFDPPAFCLPGQPLLSTRPKPSNHFQKAIYDYLS